VAQNVRRLVRHAAPAAVMAVVKADAYGHGAAAVARTALQHGASWLAVYTVAEGVELRQRGANAPILVFGPFSAAEAEDIWDHRLTPTLTSLDAAARLQERSAGRETEYHLKLDTGLARAGIAPSDAVDFMRSVRSSFSSLHHTGTYTHFVSADEEDKGTTYRQISQYQESIAQLEAAGFPSALTHASNSAGLLDVPDARFTMVRTGIAIYGYYPSAVTSRRVPLVPALQLISEVIRVHEIPAGAGVGYGHQFRADRPTKIALVPIGYGDGLPRSLGHGRGRVIVRSQLAPIVGRVSMDQITVDVTGLEVVQPGDPVVLIGRQGAVEQDAEDVAGQAGTISYDILTGLMPRVPRVYVERGAVMTVSTSQRPSTKTIEAISAGTVR
jgi:alanine racemase